MLALRGRKVTLAQLEMLARLGLRVILVLQALPEKLGQLVLQGRLVILARLVIKARPESKAQQGLLVL